MTSITTLYKKKETRGDIAVRKSYMVPVDDLYIEAGFNVRELDLNHISSICESYRHGEYIPPIVVEPQESGRMKIIDGHHRYKAVMMAIDSGVEIRRIQCESFSGDESDQLAYMIKSSQGRNLSPVERGAAYKRFESHGFTRDEIAEKVGRSRGDIDHHISITEMPEDVKAQVKAGEISASLALELYNNGGSGAVSDAIGKAKETGKAKATKRHTSLWKPSMGKAVTTAIINASVTTDNSGDTVIRMAADDWAVVQEAIRAINNGGLK